MSRFSIAFLTALNRILFCSILHLALLAQNQSGVPVVGTVLDPRRAVIPAARVTLTTVTGKEVRSMASDESGTFRFEGVTPGTYQIRVEREGFKIAIVPVRVGSEPPRSITVNLTLADVRQDVTVTPESSQVSTETADNLDTVALNRSALDDLPIFDQDYVATMSAFLDPSSVGTNGATLVVDGLEATRAGVSASAIQEVKINQDPYSAQYPRPGKGRIEIITKPASPEYHGTFNFLFRDYRLNARDPFALVRPPQQRRIYEGNFGGPNRQRKEDLVPHHSESRGRGCSGDRIRHRTFRSDSTDNSDPSTQHGAWRNFDPRNRGRSFDFDSGNLYGPYNSESGSGRLDARGSRLKL
jgi:hypothetical protein